MIYAQRRWGGAPWQPLGEGSLHGWSVFLLASLHLANRSSHVCHPNIFCQPPFQWSFNSYEETWF
jgi:hypothetical protein